MDQVQNRGAFREYGKLNAEQKKRLWLGLDSGEEGTKDDLLAWMEKTDLAMGKLRKEKTNVSEACSSLKKEKSMKHLKRTWHFDAKACLNFVLKGFLLWLWLTLCHMSAQRQWKIMLTVRFSKNGCHRPPKSGFGRH